MKYRMDGSVGAVTADGRERAVAKVLLVDEHAIFRRGVRFALAREVEVVGEADDASTATALAARLSFDLVLADLSAPAIGAELTCKLRRDHPACCVLALSAVEEPVRIAEVLAAGANGYAFKRDEAAELGGAIRRTLAGEHYLPPGVSLEAIERARASISALSAREHEILQRLLSGHSNDDIACELFISRRTVETHRQRIMKKLGAHSIVELVHTASRFGLAR